MSEEIKSIGINKTKKHSYIARFSLADRHGEQDYNQFLTNQHRLVIIQVKEYPGVAVYAEYLPRDEFEEIYGKKPTPKISPRKKTLYEEEGEEPDTSIGVDTSEMGYGF